MPEERYENFKKQVKDALPGFIVLGLIVGIFLYAVFQDSKGGTKSFSTFSKGNPTVALNPVDSSEDKDLISLVYSETNGYSENVQQGLVSVVFNRLKSSDFPNNIHDVVYQPSQFESVYTESLVSYDSIPENDRKSIENIIKKAQAEDNTGGARFYYKPYQVDSDADAQIRQMDGVTVIDDVVFMTTYPY